MPTVRANNIDFCYEVTTQVCDRAGREILRRSGRAPVGSASLRRSVSGQQSTSVNPSNAQACPPVTSNRKRIVRLCSAQQGMYGHGT